MTVRDVLTQVQQDLLKNLNAFIEKTQLESEHWFKPLTFHDDAPRVDHDKYFMGIYLSSPDGEVFTGTERIGNVAITLDCILNDIRDGSSDPEKYLSAVIDYLSKKRYGISSNVTTAVVTRVDLDAPVNSFAVAINVTVYRTDYDLNF